MIFQYQDEDSGEPVQIYIHTYSPEPSLYRKIESSTRFWMLFHGTMIT